MDQAVRFTSKPRRCRSASQSTTCSAVTRAARAAPHISKERLCSLQPAVGRVVDSGKSLLAPVGWAIYGGAYLRYQWCARHGAEACASPSQWNSPHCSGERSNLRKSELERVAAAHDACSTPRQKIVHAARSLVGNNRRRRGAR